MQKPQNEELEGFKLRFKESSSHQTQACNLADAATLFPWVRHHLDKLAVDISTLQLAWKCNLISN